MATTAAIGAVTAAIARLLAGSGSQPTAVIVVNHPDKLRGGDGATRGLSLLLLRVQPSTLRRPPQPRRDPVTQLVHPATVFVDAHYLVTAWADDAIQQHHLLGEAVRSLGNDSVMTAGQLNGSSATASVVFGPDETVELLFDSISLQDLAHCFTLAPAKLQASVAYIARGIGIDATPTIDEGPPVRTRELAYTDRASAT